MNQISHLLKLADAYIEATSIKEVTLSHRLFGDSKKIGAMRAGADITISRFNSAISWFSDNWPDGADWPEQIMRPASENAA